MKEKENKSITVSIKSDNSEIRVQEEIKSVCCFIKKDDGFRIISGGEFSILDCLDYASAFDSIIKSLLNKSEKFDISIDEFQHEQKEEEE